MNYRTYQEYQKAFAEINFILENSEKNIQEKIPDKFTKMVKDNMDRSYIVKLNLNEGLENCVLLDKTKKILSFIYKNFICSEKECDELLKKWENKKQEYDIEKILDNNKCKETNSNKFNQIVKTGEKKWYEKIRNKILNIFKK